MFIKEFAKVISGTEVMSHVCRHWSLTGPASIPGSFYPFLPLSAETKSENTGNWRDDSLVKSTY